MTYDVAIAGAGIVGAACAAECAAAGLSVVVVDRGPVGGRATAAGMGHIVVMDDSPAQIALTLYSRERWIELRERLPDSVEYTGCGTLWIAADEEEMAEVRRKKAVYDSIGVRAEVLGPAAVAEAEPHLREGLAGGLLVPDDSSIYPPCAARWLLDGAIAQGAEFRVGRVTAVSGAGLVLEDGSFIAAGSTVLATGEFAPDLVSGLPVRRRKGHLAITDRYPGFVRHALVELGYLKSAHSAGADSVAFNAQPRRTGQVLLGSSRQFDVEDEAIDWALMRRMIARAVEYLPGIGALTGIRTWTGFRAATADHLPLIGPTESDPRLLLAVGHEGLGITTSLGTGRLIADWITGRTSPIAREPYVPARARMEAAHAH